MVIDKQFPTPVPSYVLKGHACPISFVDFCVHDKYLISGDDQGYICVWDLSIFRPVISWKAHDGTILSIKVIDTNVHLIIITHGRNDGLKSWQASSSSDNLYGSSNILICPNSELGIQLNRSLNVPRMIDFLEYPCLNFCPASMMYAFNKLHIFISNKDAEPFVNLVIYDTEFRLTKLSIVDIEKSKKETGSIMHIDTCYSELENLHLICIGFESGLVAILSLDLQEELKSTLLYMNKNHAQPIMSVRFSRHADFVISSSADDRIIKHPVPKHFDSSDLPLAQISTKHYGQQCIQIRPNNDLFITAGFKGSIRLYTVMTLTQIARLKWHKESIRTVSFSRESNGKEVAAGSSDGKISMWKLQE